MLYPIKFKPILKDKIWGGSKLSPKFKELQSSTTIGESWELSDLEDDISVVSNGKLEEVTLTELMEIYMGELVGDSNFNYFGLGFPLLIKFIDANLSFQVHPDDEFAEKHYGLSGKTEMWYVVEAEPESGIYAGFKNGTTRAQAIEAIENQTIESIVQFYPVKKGDVFYVPAGTVHAIGKGVLVAEIQQTSDVTLRIYDWNRIDDAGHPRELHIEEAKEAIHFEEQPTCKVNYQLTKNTTCKLIREPFFNVNILELDQPIEKNYIKMDSFVIYICVEGEVHYFGEDFHEVTYTGETILIPASINEMNVVPNGYGKVLEVYIS